jgi:hypothetical protein
MRGCSLDEVIAKTMAMVDAFLTDILDQDEITMCDFGASNDDIKAEQMRCAGELGTESFIAPFISAPQLDATIKVPPCCATYFQNLLTGVVSNGPWRRWHLRQAKKG